jgi:hypothetical protein
MQANSEVDNAGQRAHTVFDSVLWHTSAQADLQATLLAYVIVRALQHAHLSKT